MKRKQKKNISYDLSKENLSEQVKTLIQEHMKIIESLDAENRELRKEIDELKKTSFKSFFSRKPIEHKAFFR